jgi:NAD(P)-dependent dehydrogenase (short-subunit alcohol dehydrogenase family)
LADLLVTRGETNAPLVLIGSTFADAGRHNYRMPLYSLAKTLVPSLVHILAVELGTRGQRCVGLEFDVLDGGMNEGIKPGVRMSHADRSPFGTLGTLNEAASQVEWVLANVSTLMSGAVIRLSGGSLP